MTLDGPGSDGVRRLWLRDYHADGLRLDAVHALIDTSATHILEPLAATDGVELPSDSAVILGRAPSR